MSEKEKCDNEKLENTDRCIELVNRIKEDHCACWRTGDHPCCYCDTPECYVDAVTDDWAIDVGCEFVRVPALWHAFGNTAGFVRNEFMVDALKPHMAIAFIHNKSRGATHCAEYATKKGVDTLTIRIDD
jgi:uncharacterized protein (DUF779 family)